MSVSVDLHAVGGEAAGDRLGELTGLYGEVYGEPPHYWGSEHAVLFAERFEGQRHQDGFALVEARDGEQLVGVAFGVTLRPETPWWQGLLGPLPAATTTEYPRAGPSPWWSCWSAHLGGAGTSGSVCMTACWPAARRNGPP